jgi:hypothetical protein
VGMVGPYPHPFNADPRRLFEASDSAGKVMLSSGWNRSMTYNIRAWRHAGGAEYAEKREFFMAAKSQGSQRASPQ